jgi:hypothetical protein
VAPGGLSACDAEGKASSAWRPACPAEDKTSGAWREYRGIQQWYATRAADGHSLSMFMLSHVFTLLEPPQYITAHFMGTDQRGRAPSNIITPRQHGAQHNNEALSMHHRAASHTLTQHSPVHYTTLRTAVITAPRQQDTATMKQPGTSNRRWRGV